MNSFLENEELYIKSIINELGYEIDEVSLGVSSKPEYGDYQFNGIMKLAKDSGENPRDLANKIVDRIKNDNRYKDISVAGPGFINITFSDDSLINYLNELNKDIEINYRGKESKKIVMDYGGANVAKALHVGHLRSANIGEALKRLAKSLGDEVLGDAHLGDWGRPIGLVMLAIEEKYPNLCFFDPEYEGEYPKEISVTVEDLMEMYPLSSSKAKEDPLYMEKARDMTARFQSREKGLMKLWDYIMDISKADIKRIYDKLNITFEIWEGESDCDKYIPEVIDYLTKKNVVVESQGAKVIEVQREDDDHEIPPLLLVKSNNSYSYATTDIACIWERVKKWMPDQIWYVVDSRQALHFEQVFRVCENNGIVDDKVSLEFIPFGTMNGSDGKPFKTRDGGVMRLEDLISSVYDICYDKISLDISEDEKKKIADIVSIGAIKYADLIPFRATDYNFDPLKFSDVQGKTGPYLLYSMVRMKSVLRKAEESKISFKKVIKFNALEDRSLCIGLLNLKKVLFKAYESRSLNDITEYLYKITSLYNNFYSKYYILSEEDNDLKESWLLLTKIIYDNNLKLLNILGIDVPERM